MLNSNLFIDFRSWVKNIIIHSLSNAQQKSSEISMKFWKI